MMCCPDTGPVSANHGARNMTKIALEIGKLARLLAVLPVILLPLLHAAPAHAAPAFNTWLSHNGVDGPSCTRSSPCLTFQNALLNKTQVGGEVSCLDSGNFGTFEVTFSLTIDCRGTMAQPSFDNMIGCHDTYITINAPGAVVILRGLTLIGFNLNGCAVDNGISIGAAAAVYIEDCVIENFAQRGILDQRTSGGTKLVIKNTIVRNNGSAGIVAGAAPRNSVVLENVQSIGNTYGIAVASGNNVVINRSVMSENSGAGIEADPGAYVFVDNTEVSQNASYGIYALGTVGLTNSDIAFNASGIFGTTMSYGNNRLFQNGPGTAPTPVGATSTDFGQQ
jgi:hypothetical protein